MPTESMQKWFSIQGYSKDFLRLVYKYYADCGISYVGTYYSLNIPVSTTDLSILDGGSYELTGNMSGLMWNRIFMFPLYNIEYISNVFNAEERGFGKFDQISSFNFPTIYGIKPQPHDHILFEETILNDDTDEYFLGVDDNKHNPLTPIYQVVNFEKATNTPVSFWKCNIKISHRKEKDFDNHIYQNYVFIDQQKRIYSSDIGTRLLDLINKNGTLNINNYYKENIGYYFLNKDNNSKTPEVPELSSSVDENCSELQALLEQEIIDRTNADNDLQAQIDQELVDRSTADAELQNQIDQEILNRTNADDALQNHIDILYNDVDDNTSRIDVLEQGGNLGALSSSVDELELDLNQEIIDRIAGDDWLQDQIDVLNPATNLQLSSSVDELESDLNQEIIDRTNADIWLQDQIYDLSSSVDNDPGTDTSALSSSIDELESRVTDLEQGGNLESLSSTVSELELDLNQEIIDRTNADIWLQDQINELTDDYLSSTVDIYDILSTKADLDNDNLVPVSQIPPEAKEMRYVSNIASRDAISEKFIGLTVLVEDATADLQITSGAAIYFCTQVTPSVLWTLLNELNKDGDLQDQIDLLSSTSADISDSLVQEVIDRFNSDISLQDQIYELSSSVSEMEIGINLIDQNGSGKIYKLQVYHGTVRLTEI
jgi:hypothetical protein